MFTYLTKYIYLYSCIWGVCIASGVTICLYIAFQRIDFSKVFKPNSTSQIKSIILFISLAIGIICALGFSALIYSIFNMF